MSSVTFTFTNFHDVIYKTHDENSTPCVFRPGDKCRVFRAGFVEFYMAEYLGLYADNHAEQECCYVNNLDLEKTEIVQCIDIKPIE
jgi:hypothetical protein